MSSIARPPDPCLAAIVLIVRLRGGPRFVFHYPPSPSPAFPSPPSTKTRRRSRAKSTGGKSSDSTTPTSDEGSSSEDEGGTGPASAGAAGRMGSVGTGAGVGEKGLKSRLSDRSLGRTSPSPLHGSVSASSVTSAQKIKSEAETGLTPGGSSTDLALRRTDSGQGKSSAELGDPPWENFLGLKTDVWEKLLCPAPAWHKRRFEVGLNDLTFVGWPVFARDNGMWRKRRTRRKTRGEDNEENGAVDAETEREADSGVTSPRGSELANLFDSTESLKLGKEKEKGKEKKGKERQKEKEDGSKGEMTMFNVVFVLNPPILEYHLRVKEKYENVIKKFGKGLKAEQVRADYVWTEVQKILHIKEKARESGLSLSELYSDLLSQSSLAQAIATVYNSISNSRIASVTLTPETTMSLQIPPLTSTLHLPSPTEPSYPGLWLTTADCLSATDEASGETAGPTKVLAKHFALLLLVDEATILKDIDTSMGSIGQPLAHYIRCSKPNKSFAQISAQSQIPLTDIQVLANHLIYWRRARAIPPLNQRDTYIVSPNADMSKLALASVAYEAAFPTMPSLPKMLSALSGTPRPYSTFIPSRDHKQTYLNILAWLMRGGWVTQLRTFGWIKADPEVKKAVAEAMAREEEEKEEINTSKPEADQEQDGIPGEMEGDDIDENASSSSSSLASELSGDATPIPGRYGGYHYHQTHPADTDAPTTSSLILRPHRASPIESRWLDEILNRISDHHHLSGSFTSSLSQTSSHSQIHGQSQNQSQSQNSSSFGADSEDASITTLENSLQKHWPAFTKYFNGTDALEKIPVREGLKRKVVWKLLSCIDVNSGGQSQRGAGSVPGTSAGPLESHPSDKVLVTVRHW